MSSTSALPSHAWAGETAAISTKHNKQRQFGPPLARLVGLDVRERAVSTCLDRNGRPLVQADMRRSNATAAGRPRSCRALRRLQPLVPTGSAADPAEPVGQTTTSLRPARPGRRHTRRPTHSPSPSAASTSGWLERA